MIFVKIAIVGAALIALMGVAKDQNWAQRVGVTGTCYAVQAPVSSPGGAWYACKQGILTSFPSLESEGCEEIALIQHEQVWKCTDPLFSLPGY
jgi:hypothetical protein